MALEHDGIKAIASIPSSVRDVIRRTMVLAFPEEQADRPTFFFLAGDEPATLEGEPWDWTTAPTGAAAKASVQPLCAYEFFAPLGESSSEFTEVGTFEHSAVVFTLFEEEFAEVFGFSYATIGPGDRKWNFRYWRPVIGLGGITVYQVHCSADDL